MISRRWLLVAGAASLLATPSRSDAQPAGKGYRIGWLGLGTDLRPAYDTAFRAGLALHGVTVGQNAAMEFRWLGNSLSPNPALAAELVKSHVDVIVAFGTPAVLSAREATRTIPIVMVGARDPVELGVIVSLARPGGNITGISSTVTREIAAKRLAIIKEALPRASRIAHLWSSKFPGTRPYVDHITQAAAKLQVSVQAFDVGGPEDLPATFAKMKQGAVDAVSVEPALASYRKQIIELAAASRLPTLYGNSVFVEEGGLMGYSPDWIEILSKAGKYAGMILKGARPSDLPVEQPTKFQLMINAKTAKALGLTISPSLWARADQIIE